MIASALPYTNNSTSLVTEATNSKNVSAESYVRELAVAVEAAVREIRRVNDNTRTLALNARIEAARAGSHGAAFGVVASEMQQLSTRTTEVANSLATVTNEKIADLLDLIGSNIRGTRLSDLARTNVDLIDRCLYERTCDVRWWATDSSLTNALSDCNEESFAYASQRMGVILNAYTVYHDLVLCNTDGKIVANGRPERFRSIGLNVSHASWFQGAMRSHSGNEFSFESAHVSSLVGEEPTLIYSCSVRRDGDANASVIGVLGIMFNWSSLALPILQNVPLSAEEREGCEFLIVDHAGRILASQDGCAGRDQLHLMEFERIQTGDKGFFQAEYKGRPCCIAYARAPGFETYSTGWYALIIQPC